MRKRLQRAAAIGMAAILCIQNAQFGLTTFADELSDFARMEEIMNAQAMRMTPADAVENLSAGEHVKDSDTGENGEIKENPDGNSEGQENEYEIATDSNADISDEKKNDWKNEPEQDKTSAAKIYDFIWQDPEEYLNDGRLELSVTAEEQPTFEQIVSILPQSILAKTGETAENTSADEEEDITTDYDVEIEVSGWQCADYIQNEDGMWPTSGTFTFSAEPEDGYELADGCAPLAVEVAVSDEAAMLVTDIRYDYILSIVANGQRGYWGIDNGNLISQGTIPAGVTVTVTDGTYELNLNNANLEQVAIKGGTWKINVEGANTISCKYDAALFVQNNDRRASNIVFTGSGSLTVESQAICAVYLGDDTRASMNSGSYEIKAAGTTEERGVRGALSLNSNASMTIDGATVNVSQTSGESGIDLSSKNSLTIKSGTVTASGGDSLLCSSASTVTISEKGKFIAQNAIRILGGTLVNEGILVLNGNLEGNGGTFQYADNASIEGPGKVTNEALKPSANVKTNGGSIQWISVSNSIDVSQYFIIPKNAKSKVKYNLESSTVTDSSLNGSVLNTNGANGASYHIQAIVSNDNVFKDTTIDLTLIMTIDTSSDGMKIEVYKGVYDAEKHQAITLVTPVPTGTTVVYYARQTSGGEDIDWTEKPIMVEDVRECKWYKYKLGLRSGSNQNIVWQSGEYEIEIAPLTITNQNAKVEELTVPVGSEGYEAWKKYGSQGKIKDLVFYNGKTVYDLGAAVQFDSYVIEPSEYGYNGYSRPDSNYSVSKPGKYLYKINISGVGIYGSNFNKSTVLATVIFQGEKLTPALRDDVTITEVYNGTGTYTLDASNIIFKKTSGDVVSDVTASGTVTLQFTDAAVGENKEYTISGISLDSAGADGYELSGTTITGNNGTITPASLEGHVTAGSKVTYDGQAHKLEVNVDVPEALKNQVKITYGSEYSESLTFKEAGSYTVSYQVSCPNYDTYSNSGILQIDKKGMTLTADPKTINYGDAAPEYTVTPNGLAAGDTLENQQIKPKYSCSYTQGADTGTYTIAPVVEDSQVKNYTITCVPGTLTVKPVNPVFTASANKYTERKFNGTSVDMTPTVSGGGAITKKIVDQATQAQATEDPVHVGTYKVTYTAEASKNYTTGSVSYDFKITPASGDNLVVAFNQAEKPVYGSGSPAVVSPTITSTIEPSVTDFGAEFLYSADGTEGSYRTLDELTPTLSAGEHTIHYELTSRDYEKKYGELNIEVLHRTFTETDIQAADYEGTYDGSFHTIEVKLSDEVKDTTKILYWNDETNSYSEEAAPVYRDAGQYTVKFQVTNPNYIPKEGNATVRIDRKVLTITASPSNAQVIYGDEKPEFTAVFDGFVTGESESENRGDLTGTLNYDCDYHAGSPVKDEAYTVTPSGLISAKNYEIRYKEGSFTVEKKDLTVTADDKMVIVGNPAPTFTVSYDGFVNGDDEQVLTGTPEFVCDYDVDTGAVGMNYLIQPVVTGMTAANYHLIPAGGTLTVTDKLIPTITTADSSTWKSRVYDGTTTDLKASADGDGVLTVTVKDAEGNILNGFPKHAGSYTAILSYAEGQTYAAKEEKYSFEILPAPLTITAEDKNVVFGAKAPEYTVVYDGFVNGETEAVLTGTLVVTCNYTVESREYTYEIIPSGLSAKNYAITWKNGVLTARYPESDSDDYEETSKPANSKMPKSGTNNPGQGATAKDAKKGYVNENSGIVSGKTLTEEMLKNDDGSLNDGYSHWIQTNAGWWFRYADGSYPKAAGAVNSGSGNSSAAQSYEWVQIDGKWWSFDSNGYLGTGWIIDPVYKNWFYVDVNTGMKTGWVQIDGKWYYFNPVSDGTKGIMFANRMTPDGWFVREDGSWDEKR